MKKITALLGTSHNDFDRQLKDFLNEMSDVIANISQEQQVISEHQNKLFLKQYIEVLHSSICDLCRNKADIIITTIKNGTYEAFCNRCMTSK